MHITHSQQERNKKFQAIDAFEAAKRTLGNENDFHRKDESYQSENFRDFYVSSVESLTSPREKTYLSTPVTGGYAQFEFLKEHGLKSRAEMTPQQHKLFASEVVSENLKAAEELAEEIRVEKDEFVVNPGAVGAMKDWKQGDYMGLWLKTMKGVDAMTLRDGWELSTGCVLEARLGFDKGIKVRSESGDTLTKDDAMEIIRSGESKVRELGFESPDHLRILADPNFQPDEYLRTVG